MFPKKLANYIDFELFLNEKELYSIISEKIIAAVKQQRQINPIIIQEIKKILSLENITLISVNTNVEMTVFNVAYT